MRLRDALVDKRLHFLVPGCGVVVFQIELSALEAGAGFRIAQAIDALLP